MDKIKKWDSFINESLYFSSNLGQMIEYLTEVKKDKVAFYINDIIRDSYKDDSVINFLSTAQNDNMLSYLPQRWRDKNNWNGNFESERRTSIRIGRAAKKLWDETKDKLNVKYEGDGKFISSSISRDKELVSIVIPIKYENVLIVYNDNRIDTNPSKLKIEVGGLKIEKEIHSFNESDGNAMFHIQLNKSTELDELATKISYWWNYHEVNKVKPTKMKVELICDFNITDVDIEKFTNEYVSFVKSNKADKSSVIQEVKGEEIRHWYLRDNYQSTMGKLGNSCMSYPECQEYLDIYVYNKEVCSLLILKNSLDKLVGRALLWKLVDGRIFMDRVYTINDSDDNIFINYAIKNKYTYRDSLGGSNTKFYENGVEVSPGKMEVKLTTSEFDYYPYVDTIYYLDEDNNILSNIGGEKELRDTEGRWSNYYDEDY